MTTGIYKIELPDGFYIGKSRNIEERWKQHEENLRTGRAATRLQRAWDRGRCAAAYSIICECHHDHIDLLESYYVYKLRPALNTANTFPISTDLVKLIDDIGLDWFMYPTVEHISSILTLQRDKKVLEHKIDKYRKEIESINKYIGILEQIRNEEEILAAGVDVVLRWKNTATTLAQKNTELWNFLTLPWYKRIFRNLPAR